MSNNTNSALEHLEQQIGLKSGLIFDKNLPDSQLTITQSQRANVISWLTIKGVNNQSLQKNSLITLGKMYNITAYLQSVLRNQEMEAKSGKKFTRPTPTLSADIDWGKVDDSNIAGQNPTISNQKIYDNLITSTFQPDATISQSNLDQKIRNQITTENKKLQDQILQTVHQILLKETDKNQQNAESIGQKTAQSVATQIVEEKIKYENNNLKSLVEEIIFQTYLTHKQSTPESERQSQSVNSIETNSPVTTISNHHIPILDKNYHFDPYASKVIRSAIKMQENLYVYGDTGCGKTTHLEQICSVLNRGIIRINPHDGITREMFLGGMKLINNETIFVEGALPTAMRNGYIFLVDEISFLPPNLTAILNPIGEKGGKLYIPETSEWISPAPGFCIFATDNTGGKGDRTGNYTGTEVQNTATLDRFAFCLKMDYLPIDKEQQMLENKFPTQDQNEIERMLKFARDIRSAFSRGELSITFSTRKLIKFFDQRMNNFTIEESLNNTIISWLDEDDEILVKTMIDRLDLLNPPTHNTNTSTNQNIDLTNFKFFISQDQKINAIKELRQIVGTQTQFFGLKEAKDLTESYVDGHISIYELKQKLSIIMGGNI